ncbi:uncharacterized protein EDB91DRAFT_1052799, partial [Suillus paluster]|uniref:uncharacterized protein n=1 Tax=Suillus paluster TaxID=48578 RepID=UPI001B878232
NVVIFGGAGAGKSSLINLIAGTETARTSPDGLGCTSETKEYVHGISIQNKTLKVKLLDTAGLDEGSEGTVPDKECQRRLEKLLRDLRKQDGIHLLMYCVQGSKNGERAIKALRRNYKLCHSAVEGQVPIVLVVTCLENKTPEMEQWWKDNEKSISKFGMTFAGHACITTLTINKDATDELQQRHDQSYEAVCKLFEICCTRCIAFKRLLCCYVTNS